MFKPIRRKSPSRKGSSNSHRNLPQQKKKSVRKAKSASLADDSSAREKKEVTVLSPAAMENLYYIAHSAVDALEIRGFGWEGDRPRKKKKGKKGKKK